MNKLLIATTVGVFASGMAFAAFAQNGPAHQEVATAHAHALMAQNAETVAKAHTHLHHVVNCLVGPGGKGFDASAGNPCKGQGDGALSDTVINAELHGKVKQALSEARAGLQADKLTTIHGDAAMAAATLQFDH
ncbi:MAG TPA: hypothetical protein VFJ15_10870 [Oleiagrimonas sp.]|nr:hypothetical protein [Oleiagrimonas sp.]